MKRSALFALALALAVPSVTAQAADARPIRLTMTSQYMDRHPVAQKVWMPWIEEIKKRTNGRVIITYYNPNTLCPDGEVLDAVLKGQVDIGEHLNSRNPGRLPLNTVPNKVPMVISTGKAGTLAYWDLYNSTPELHAEFKGLRMLALHTTASIQINTNKPVARLEDLKGLRVIGGSKETMLVINSLGLNGLMQPPPDIYMAMTRNMGDAVLFPVPPMRSFKVNEAVKFTTYADAYIGTAWLGMNQAKWDSLPPDVQKIFEETTGDIMCAAIGDALDQGERDDLKIMEAAGHKFSTLAPEERERWRQLMEPYLKEAWLKEVEKTGIADPEALYQKTFATMRKYEDLYGRAAIVAKAAQ